MAEFMRRPGLMDVKGHPSSDFSAPDPPLPAFACRECDERYDPNRLQARIERVLVHNQLCHKCQHWTEIWMERNDPRRAFIEGMSHTIGDEDAEPRSGLMRGCGGSRFVIAFFDGRKVETTNLWNQGEIPAHFRERLPDNASFVQESRGPEWDFEAESADFLE